jgi:twitching motility protein PilI
MANREALRDLHSRLATRLQAARSGDVGASWLGVVAGGQNYLLPLGQAGEIFPWTPSMTVPYTQSWFNGVTNLRGGLFGVVDLAAFIAGERRALLSDSARAEARFVTFNPALETNGALLIDRLAGLRHVDAFSSSETLPAGAAEFFGTVYIEANGVRWQEINLQALSRESHFLSISA